MDFDGRCIFVIICIISLHALWFEHCLIFFMFNYRVWFWFVISYEWHKPSTIISAHLNDGSRIKPNASKGNTHVFVNDQEIKKVELQMLQVENWIYTQIILKLNTIVLWNSVETDIFSWIEQLLFIPQFSFCLVFIIKMTSHLLCTLIFNFDSNIIKELLPYVDKRFCVK